MWMWGEHCCALPPGAVMWPVRGLPSTSLSFISEGALLIVLVRFQSTDGAVVPSWAGRLTGKGTPVWFLWSEAQVVKGLGSFHYGGLAISLPLSLPIRCLHLIQDFWFARQCGQWPTHSSLVHPVCKVTCRKFTCTPLASCISLCPG